MDRATLTIYLSVVLAELLTLTNIGDTDGPQGLEYPLDQTYETVDTDDSGLAFQAVGEYYTLLRVRNVLASRVDFDATAYQKRSRSSVFKQVEALIEGAAQRSAAAGYPMDGSAASTDAYGLTELYMDYLEPTQ